MTMPPFHRILATTALCLAAVGLSSCSYCLPSLHTSEAVLHRDHQVVVCLVEPITVKYRYQCKDYYPIRLAYAVDKGAGIYQRGDCRNLCRMDTSERFEIQEASICTYLYEKPSESSLIRPELLIPEKDFNFTEAECIKLDGDYINRVHYVTGMPYDEIRGAVNGMPITEPAEAPAVWRYAALAPLVVVDIAGTVALFGVDVATGVLLLPVYAVKNAFEGKLHLE